MPIAPRPGRRLSAVGLTAFLAAWMSAAPAHAQSCRQLPRGVVAWWTGDDTSNDVTLGAHHGLLLNGASYGAGAIGRAFHLDGVNDRIDVADSASLRPSRFTLAAWVRLDTSVGQGCIICKQVGSGDANSYSLWLFGATLRGGMFRYAEAVDTAPLPAGRFVHTAVSYDGSIIRLYRDGELIAAAPGPASAVPYDTNQVILGADDNGSSAYTGFFPGTIDEAQIFDRALSSCEIRALYRARPAGSCKGDTDDDLIPDCQDNCPTASNAGQVDTDADGAGDACDCAPTDASALGSPGDRHVLYFTADDRLDWCGDPPLTGTGTTYDVIRGPLSALPVSSASSVCLSRCDTPASGLVGWWPGDGSTADLVAAHNGTLENGATYGAGLVRGSFALDGVNARVRTTNVTLGNTFTVLAWVNSALVNQGIYRRIVETQFTTGFYLGVDGTGAGYKFIVRNGSSPYGAANGGAISPGDWQLVVGTYDGATGRLYVDGKLAASDTFTAPGTVSLPVNIGAHFAGGSGWKGLIDEVQIYNRALSAAEVQAIYDAGSGGQCKAALGGTDASWTAPWAADGAVPPASQGLYYLYRGRNACGVGSYGYATSGAERISNACN